MKIHYVLKGTNENPYTKMTKKGHNNKKPGLGGQDFSWILQILFEKCLQNPSEKGGTRSTWLNNNYSINNNKIQQPSYPRATPFPPDNGILSARASSPTSWGELIN